MDQNNFALPKGLLNENAQEIIMALVNPAEHPYMFHDPDRDSLDQLCHTSLLKPDFLDLASMTAPAKFVNISDEHTKEGAQTAKKIQTTNGKFKFNARFLKTKDGLLIPASSAIAVENLKIKGAYTTEVVNFGIRMEHNVFQNNQIQTVDLVNLPLSFLDDQAKHEMQKVFKAKAMGTSNFNAKIVLDKDTLLHMTVERALKTNDQSYSLDKMLGDLEKPTDLG